MIKFFEYKLTLNAPLILSNNRDDPNCTYSETMISGSTIRGTVAAKIIKKGNEDDIDELILNDTVKYLPAYPEINDCRGMFLPASIKKIKYSDSYDCVNLFSYDWNSETDDGWPHEKLLSLNEYFNLGGDRTKFFFPMTNGRFHNQRNPDMGRALGGNCKSNRGAIFSYESIEASQVFRGIISIEAPDEEGINNKIVKIREYLGNRLYLGKSKGASYGGDALVEWLDDREREVKDTGNAYFPLLSFDEDFEEGKEIIILLTSPYLGRNPFTGVVGPDNFLEDIQKAFEVFNVKISFENSKICGSLQTIGSYNKTWRTEMPQLTVLSAGTVLNLKLKSDTKADSLQKIEAKGIGIRKNEGFGSFVMMDNLRRKFSFNETIIYKQPNNKPDVSCPDIAYRIENKIVLNELKKDIFKKVSNDLEACINIPPNHLLNRFRYILRNNASLGGDKNYQERVLKELYSLLSDSENGFKQPALKYLMKCHIGNNSLFDLLTDLLSDLNNSKFLDSSDFGELTNYFFLPPKDDNVSSWELFKKDNIVSAKLEYLVMLFNSMSIKNRLS